MEPKAHFYQLTSKILAHTDEEQVSYHVACTSIYLTKEFTLNPLLPEWDMLHSLFSSSILWTRTLGLTSLYVDKHLSFRLTSTEMYYIKAV